AHPGPPRRACLAQRVLDRDRGGVGPLLELLRIARPDREGDPQAPEQGPALRRGGGQYEWRGAAQAWMSPKKSATSRAADSGESEPCTMFAPTSTAKSPLMEPGAASSGLVAPITWRAALTASIPSSAIATIGPEVMKSTRSPKKGRSACSA